MTLAHTAAPLIGVDELKQAINSGASPVLLDVRWTLPQPDGSAEYARGHLPGALYVALDDDLASHSDDATQGRHPLPTPQDFQNTLRSWGVNDESAVVIYDDNRSLGAARAWWLLRWAGLENVRVLNGGLQAWIAAGGQLSIDSPTPAPGSVTVRPGSLPTLSADDTAALAQTGVVLDARAPERYRGEVEPMDPRAGHIPGAHNRPAVANTTDDQTFKSPDVLRADFAALGVEVDSAGDSGPVGVYCGSGVTASANALALASIGVEAALYPASWSGWSADPTRPANTTEV